jgi:cofilin
LWLQANARSGVAVNDECMLKFGELQSKRLHRFITFKMDDKFKEIVVDQVGDRATSYDDFTNSLPENDCRYAIYDFDFVTAEDVQKSRIFYILWYCLCPLVCIPCRSRCFTAAR